jgi:hypothetical protein
MRVEHGTGEQADQHNDARGTPHPEPPLQRRADEVSSLML